jgi:hypothetical protein
MLAQVRSPGKVKHFMGSIDFLDLARFAARDRLGLHARHCGGSDPPWRQPRARRQDSLPDPSVHFGDNRDLSPGSSGFAMRLTKGVK